jgi:dihydroxyacetone kinase-like predicted kinase
MDADVLVSVYVKMRDKRAELLKEFEAKDDVLKDKMEKVEQALLDLCKENGIESLRTEHGTATRIVKERVWAPDWDAFTKFVREHDAVDLFEKRIHQGNFREFVEANPDITPPVNIDRKYAITVRRK